KEDIQGEEVKMKGKKILDPTAGVEVGAIREFDLRGPQNVVQDILARYQMRTVTRYVSEAQVAVKYLNQAETNRGTYRSTDRPGLYEVFEIGPAGSAKMKQLEMDTLKIRGFNPRTDRLVKIVFGIVLTDKGYDLGVLDLQAEKMNP
ncbi:MAG: hypothetical protein NTW86_04140, partial [Candidatus Sumerlaeota bacterium]|nr:hypothetical protein [Candidatus Sumerlaeota bacterium]